MSKDGRKNRKAYRGQLKDTYPDKSNWNLRGRIRRMLFENKMPCQEYCRPPCLKSFRVPVLWAFRLVMLAVPALVIWGIVQQWDFPQVIDQSMTAAVLYLAYKWVPLFLSRFFDIVANSYDSHSAHSEDIVQTYRRRNKLWQQVFNAGAPPVESRPS